MKGLMNLANPDYALAPQEIVRQISNAILAYLGQFLRGENIPLPADLAEFLHAQ
jgi:hypothetical protein